MVAARFPIMVMCMIYGDADLSTAVFLLLLKTREDELPK